MDRQYTEAAKHYGFFCEGCEDNCCLTRFHHHTFLEYLCISEGYNALASETREEVREKAEKVCEAVARADRERVSTRIICPLNAEGLCILYAHRPMICRLHGISHELHQPDGKIIRGPGCETFTRQAEGKKPFRFDRTPFYMEMAHLERELKLAMGTKQRIRMTVAEIILSL